MTWSLLENVYSEEGAVFETYSAKSFLSRPVANYTKLLYIHLFPFLCFSASPLFFTLIFFLLRLRVGEKSWRRMPDKRILGVVVSEPISFFAVEGVESGDKLCCADHTY